MGGRLSMPHSPDKTSEISQPTSPHARSWGRSINGRTLTAPLAALTMAGLLFIYARTSIRAAKLNAQKHREADGGQMNWYAENLRRHGVMEKVEDDAKTFGEALREDVRRARGKGHKREMGGGNERQGTREEGGG
ncbi:hypothetical protein M501DRAFT_607740 [Patellaria atrata CBS 101060]|uniref:Uncharacterized protein n=1 Tax=Patellaria atrata CBS 101060 TaxID=1346257 RepID=A0A9P4SD67_9PEZI|nr:hypothetical protein M501DRAFT_607740 [Patellaria atrata CBS 101060]